MNVKVGMTSRLNGRWKTIKFDRILSNEQMEMEMNRESSAILIVNQKVETGRNFKSVMNISAGQK